MKPRLRFISPSDRFYVFSLSSFDLWSIHCMFLFDKSIRSRECPDGLDPPWQLRSKTWNDVKSWIPEFQVCVDGGAHCYALDLRVLPTGSRSLISPTLHPPSELFLSKFLKISTIINWWSIIYLQREEGACQHEHEPLLSKSSISSTKFDIFWYDDCNKKESEKFGILSGRKNYNMNKFWLQTMQIFKIISKCAATCPIWHRFGYIIFLS